MPLVKAANELRTWFISVFAYTAGGVITSSLLGTALGGLGAVIVPTALTRGISVGIMLSACVAVMARELHVVDFALPQWRRQTSQVWGKVLPLPLAAGLWGFDLGLAFTTWLTFTGPWLLALIAMLGRDIPFAIGLFVAYWLGRALTVWLAPLAIRTEDELVPLMSRLTGERALFHNIHIVGVGWAAITLSLTLLGSNPT